MELLEHNAEAFCRLSSLLGQALVLVETNAKIDSKALSGNLGELQREAKRLGLSMVDKQLDRIYELLMSQQANSLNLSPLLKELYNRLLDELESRAFVTIPSSDVALYKQAEPPFGHEVQSKFPRASYDIDEACKCVALGRSTAGVFHLMRVMEIALRAVNTCLGGSLNLAGNEKNWGSLLNSIRDARNAKDASAPKGSKWQEKDLFAEIYALLDAVKDAWRNSTMHIERTYTDPEARAVLVTVKNFMQKLADRMDEAGQPLT